MKPYQRPVNSTYGAPMGRHSDTLANLEGAEVRLERVPFVDGDYDEGGAYWGGGRDVQPLFCAWNEEENVVCYFRSDNRQTATAELQDNGVLVIR